MFSAPSATTGREQVDITGLIGQYAHGNEPSHHIAWLYNYIGKPEKTTAKIHYILDNFYKNAPDGLIGNEDCGQMSAWYVLSSMGIYAVTPGKPEWSTTEPLFDAVKVHFDDKTSGDIQKDGNNENLHLFGFMPSYGKPFTESMHPIVPVPVIEATNKSFTNKAEIAVLSANKEDRIYFKTDNKPGYNIYEKPIEITSTTKVSAYIDNYGERSDTVSANFFKKPNNFTIDIKSKYNPQYHAGGPEGLIDGIFGTENWRKGEWQGYQSQDFEATINLQKEQKVSEISANFLQDSRAWILMPVKVEFYISTDNINFTLAKTLENTLDPKISDTKIIDFKATINPVYAKYIKIKAYNYGKLPEWHQGAGGDAFIFIDEITIR
jgi:hypothetical protein